MSKPVGPGLHLGSKDRRGRWRPPVNITAVERVGQALLGALGIVAGAILLAGAGGAVATVLKAALVLAGADLAVNGALRPCPLYRKLGYVPSLAEEAGMNEPDASGTASHHRPDSEQPGRHGWMMIACCIAMLVIAIALVARGVIGAGFLLVAVGCTAMMAMMMRGTDRGDGTGQSL